jgi:hypothetical protein
MRQIQDWRGHPIQVAQSKGGVIAVVDPWDNLIRTSVQPWPAPELIQKIYQSRHKRAFINDDHVAATAKLGFYSDLQSMHSEDSITWSAFGPIIYADPATRAAFVRDLLTLINIHGTAKNAHVWLWRRLPHPDTLVPGGPEIDFGIHTDDIFLLGEAKWHSSVGKAQGVHGDKDQLTLRHEFCQKYGRRLLTGVRHFVVLGVSRQGGMVSPADTEADGVLLHLRDITWKALSDLESHPCATELRQYLSWKAKHSRS